MFLRYSVFIMQRQFHYLVTMQCKPEICKKPFIAIHARLSVDEYEGLFRVKLITEIEPHNSVSEHVVGG